jgi:hypothetical protein
VEEADSPEAKRLYETGFAKWRLVIDEFPTVLDEESNIGEDILEYIKGYRDVLDQLDETIGEDFPLWEVIEKFDREQDFVEELKQHKERQGAPAESSQETPQSSSDAGTEAP